jgi:NAD(P)-dependent dehydrogenase (short-subunit alcohol dehydrogenase family)
LRVATGVGDKKVLVLGAETGPGGAIVAALAGGGAQVAAVASDSGAEAAFAVKRLARRTGEDARVLSQAIDARNEMAVRVMVRQVAKEMGGLDAAVVCSDTHAGEAAALALRFAGREIGKGGGGEFVVVAPSPPEGLAPPPDIDLIFVPVVDRPEDEVAREVLGYIGGAPHNG